MTATINIERDYKQYTSEMIHEGNKNKFYKLHKQLAYDQGRKPAWVIKQLDCSYSMYYHYLNGIKYMSLEKVRKVHKILVGV